MVSLNELCTIADPLQTATESLHRACASPRTPADMNPLPDPHLDVSFDSSWEALLAGTGAVEHWGE